jgi:aarF domain-containing kinase
VSIGSSKIRDMTCPSVAVLDASSMPPAPAFGWLCVVHAIADIAFRAAQIRSVRALPKSSSQIPPTAITRENRSHGGPTRPHSAETDARASLEPLLHSHVTGKVAEGSAVYEESSPPEHLKVVTSYQDNALSQKFSRGTESDVDVSFLMFLLKRTRHNCQ